MALASRIDAPKIPTSLATVPYARFHGRPALLKRTAFVSCDRQNSDLRQTATPCRFCLPHRSNRASHRGGRKLACNQIAYQFLRCSETSPCLENADLSSADEFTARGRFAERIAPRAELDPAESSHSHHFGSSARNFDTRRLTTQLHHTQATANHPNDLEAVDDHKSNVDEDCGSHCRKHGDE